MKEDQWRLFYWKKIIKENRRKSIVNEKEKKVLSMFIMKFEYSETINGQTKNIYD